MNKESSEQIQPQTRVLEEERPPAQELDQPEASDELPIPTAGPKPVVGSEQTGKELTNTASDKVSPSPWRPIGAVAHRASWFLAAARSWLGDGWLRVGCRLCAPGEWIAVAFG